MHLKVALLKRKSGSIQRIEGYIIIRSRLLDHIQPFVRPRVIRPLTPSRMMSLVQPIISNRPKNYLLFHPQLSLLKQEQKGLT